MEKTVRELLREQERNLGAQDALIKLWDSLTHEEYMVIKDKLQKLLYSYQAQTDTNAKFIDKELGIENGK